MSEHAILRGLNEEQRRAVTAPPGPLLVVAGPGSGKTRVLTHRIAWYVQEWDIRPYSIVAVTFTNKAATEMRERAGRLLGGGTLGAQVRTFHSLCARLLRQEFAHTNFSANYLIYDTVDQRAAIKQAVAESNIHQQQYSPRLFLHAISAAKNKLQTSRDFVGKDYFGELVARVFPHYEQLLARNDARDFDDLLLHTVQLFQRNTELRDKYQRFFAHLLVDEFQDTNHAQYELIRILAPPRDSLFIVGDPNQAIYGFRGADYRNLIRFRSDFPAAEEITLFRNYRSPQFVLDLASALINHNPQRAPLHLLAERAKQKPAEKRATLYRADDDEDEARFVAERILSRLHDEDGPLRDCVVMYRTNAQSRALETEFTRQNIPYQLIGGVSFYRRQEVRDILAYLRFLDNPRDTVSFERIINTPRRGIGRKTLSDFHVWTVSAGLNYGDALDTLREQGSTPQYAPHATADKADEKEKRDATPLNGLRLSAAGKKNLLAFAKQLDGWRELAKSASVALLLRKIVDDIGFWDYLAKISDTEAQRQEREENIEELEQYLIANPELSLADFLTETTLVSDADALDDERDVATLQTLHTAKGLEYSVVFIVGLEEGTLPHQLSLMEKGGEQEERRLLYVGITRSMSQLYLSFSDYRSLIRGARYQDASRFLRELPLDLLENEKGQALNSLRAGTRSLPSADAPRLTTAKGLPEWARRELMRGEGPGNKIKAKAKTKPKTKVIERKPVFSIGARVRHPRFGTGEVLDIEPLGTLDYVLTIHFDNGQFGGKRLIASRAKLECLP